MIPDDANASPRIALIGDAAIADYCLSRLIDSGFRVVACLPGSRSFAAKARSYGVPVMPVDAPLRALLETPCDWILSVVNLRILPEELLTHPARGVINFHDGPLPRYAGLYAPTRALLDGEAEHGVTWHAVDSGIDTGNLLVSETLPIDPEDTSLSLQLRCVKAGCTSFDRLLPMLRQEDIDGRPQDPRLRTVFGNRNWSRVGLEIDWAAPRSSTMRVIRAHDFGPHANFVGRPRFRLQDRWHALTEAEACQDPSCANADAAPGATRLADGNKLHVRCGDACLVVFKSEPPVSGIVNSPVEVRGPAQLTAIEAWDRSRFTYELEWRRRLAHSDPLEGPAEQPGEPRRIVLGPADEDLACGLLAHQGLHGGGSVEFSLAWSRAEIEVDLTAGAESSLMELLHPFAPVRFPLAPSTRLDEALHGVLKALAKARQMGPFLGDLLDRDGLSGSGLQDPADLPVRVTEDKSGRHPAALWMFQRDEEGQWAATGPGTVMDSFTELLTHRRRTLVEDPQTTIESLPRVTGATAQKVEGWEGDTSISTPPSFLELIVTRLRSGDPRKGFLESPLDGGATDAEMAVMVEGWAEALHAAGVGVGDLVPIRLERGTPFVAVMFAVLGLGATFVPIDPLAPEARLHDMLQLLGARVGVTEGQGEAVGDGIRWIVSASTPSGFLNRVSRPNPNGVAFVLFTSGSTGRPKGIRLTHRNFNQYFDTVADAIHPDAFERSAWTSSVAFDSSIAEIVFPLLQGGTIVAFEREDLASVPAFLDKCRREAITGIGCATALWSSWMRLSSTLQNPMPPSIRHVDIGGSAADPDLVNIWLQVAGPDRCLMNRYGPTETTETVTAHRITADTGPLEVIPIGRPERGCEIRVLDAEGRRVPPGHQGEIWVGGGQVAAGYLGLPDESGGFQTPPDADGPWFRTGDCASWSKDGELLFHGRADDQIKVGGYRVELGEVRIAIQDSAAARVFEVLAPNASVGPILAVLVEWRGASDEGGAADDATEWSRQVERALEARLPRYAIPRRWRFVDSLPRTASGKVDRTIALEMVMVDANLGETRHEPGTRLWILDQVERALGRREIDTSLSFFELGGDSLSAMELHAALEAEGGCSIPITLVHIARDIDDLFERYQAATRPGVARAVSTGHRCEALVEREGRPEVLFMPGLHGEAPLRLLWAPLGKTLSVSAINLDLQQCQRTLGAVSGTEGLDALIKELAELVLSRAHKAPPVMVGYSLGGWLAFGIARECLRRGIRVPPPVLIEPEFHVSLPPLRRARQSINIKLDWLINLDPIRKRVPRWRPWNSKIDGLDPRDPRGRLPDNMDFRHEWDVDLQFERLLGKSLKRHAPRPADVEILLVSRKWRWLRYAGWSRIALGGVRRELVNMRHHEDFYRYGSEDVLVDLIRRHVDSDGSTV
jgi:polyketide synthase PksN